MDKNLLRFYSEMSGAVMAKILFVVSAFFLGRALDGRWGTYPLFTFGLLVVSMALGIWFVVYMATRNNPPSK